MIVKLLLLLSLISAIASMKSESSINARFGFCFFALFSSLLPLAFEKFLAFISHLLLLGIFAPTSIALLGNKPELKIKKLRKRGSLQALIFIALTALLLTFLLSLGTPMLEALFLSATALIGFYGALLAQPLMKRFFGILIIEGELLPWLGIVADARLLIASPIIILGSIIAMLYTIKFV